MRCALLVTVFSAAAFPQTGELIVLHKGASSLGFYTADGKPLASVPVGQHPHEMVLSRDGRFAYTTDNGTMAIEQEGTGGNTVSIIDLKTRERAGVVNLGKFRRPHGIDIDHQSNRLAVSTELPDQLLIIDPVKRAIVRTLDTKGKTSHIVKFGAGAKWAYVSNSNSANVSAIHMETGAVTLIPAGMRPEGSVLSRDSRELYVCNREGASITVIDTAKNAVTGQIRTGKGPVRVDITPDSRYLVYALIHENKVEIADLAARKAVAQVPLGGSPVSLHLSPDGKFAFAAAQDRDTVYVVSVPERKLVREFKTAAGAGPDPVMQIR